MDQSWVKSYDSRYRRERWSFVTSLPRTFKVLPCLADGSLMKGGPNYHLLNGWRETLAMNWSTGDVKRSFEHGWYNDEAFNKKAQVVVNLERMKPLFEGHDWVGVTHFWMKTGKELDRAIKYAHRFTRGGRAVSPEVQEAVPPDVFLE